MKYFTKQLWIDAQQPGDAGGAVGQRYEDAFAAYTQELETLRHRLSPDAFAFFQNGDVHDGRLIQFGLRDFDPGAPKPAPCDPHATECGMDGGDAGARYRVHVELSVAEWTETQWTLRYSGIRRILIDYPSASPLFFSPGDGFEDWGYHELSDAGDGFLRHEVLFSSGAVVLLEFRDLSVERIDRPSRPTPS